MKVIAYTDPLTVAPGESLAVKVSAQSDYRAELVRLVHGDLNPLGPGLKTRPVAAAENGHYPGRPQPLLPGSCIRIDAPPAATAVAVAFTLAAWVYPTTPQRGEQGILTQIDVEGSRGYGLCIDASGSVALWIGDGTQIARYPGARPLAAAHWTWIAATRAADGTVRIVQSPLEFTPGVGRIIERRYAQTPIPLPATTGFLIAACAGEETRITRHYNGKIEAPALFRRALDDAALADVRAHGAAPGRPELVAAWDFARDFDTDRITDISGNGLHGRTLNLPARAMTGHAWSGDECDFKHAPQEYGAIHFHDDDLEDANWQSDFTCTIPMDLPSGVYAWHLRCEDAHDYVPFFVRPGPGSARARAAILLPTASYLAYANENFSSSDLDNAPNQHPSISKERYDFARAQRLKSCYDKHSDGSGVCYSSRKRPMVEMRPDHRHGSIACPHGLGADLYLIDWMEAQGFAYDILTDEILHREGHALLDPYRVVLSGSHPEYWSAEMLDALAAYQDGGGRFMYLGGNGLYWVTSYLPDKPHVIEVRRAEGVRSWTAAPGEIYHGSTGQRGGLWRTRGRAPQRYTGVGFTAQGFDFCRPYRRLEGSFDPRAAFIFGGIGTDELIGDFPSLVLHRGAGGFEIDRADPALGTPAHALVLASTFGHSNAYQHTVEEVRASNSKQGGRVEPRVRADMVFYECPNGGAVFSVGSIAWTGSLSYDHYDNTVARVTGNVLRRFLDDTPF